GMRDVVRAESDLRSDTEDGVDEVALRYGIALGDPAHLALADCMHRLITLDSSTSALDRSQPEVCRNPLLDEAMVLFDDVVQIWLRSATTPPPVCFNSATAVA